MAEAFLQLLVDNLSSLIREEIGLILGVDNEMKKLSSTLTTIQAVLEDAEHKQIESRPIRDWLCKLNLLAYEIDDILDECSTHVSKLNHSHSKLSRYNLKKILYQHKIGRRMKQVKERLDSVAEEHEKFHLREMPVDRPREVAAAASRETGSLLNEPDKIYGRKEDRDKIVKMLVEDAREKQEMSVLPIVGLGGLGKTTLAQLAFNDPRVVDHFDLRLWVCVSENFEMKALVKAMIESATRSAKVADLLHLDALEHCLWELLSQKRFLIVLDDVWNDQQEKWFELRDILSCGSAGTSIIVTTRQKKVAEIMETLPTHCLKGLSDEHCWTLLRQRALRPGEEEGYPELEIIGKQIVKKCAGVPLAAKALGGILRFKRREEEWINVRESEIWKLPAERLILPTLALSYHHLPLELRHCFAYFAAFPKDFEVEKEELILLWMGHGLISSNATSQVEVVGNEVCNELLLRSLLQPTLSNKISMHDLVHDLAVSVTENKVPGIQIERNIMSVSTIRQVNLVDRIALFPKTFQQDMDISSIMELTSLRVLNASGTGTKDLPLSIGNLKHLRYMNLSNSGILFLPNSLCNLWNLQILNLDYCHRLQALPKNMRYLQNLRHLFLADCESLSQMPSKMGELTHLKTLSTFVVGHNRGNQLEELKCLNLGGRLEIRHLERVKDHMNANKANLIDKKNLRKLSLLWERESSSKLGGDIDEKVLEALKPHKSIEELSIRGFNGRYFPHWMTNSTLAKVVEVDIRNCQNCRCLPKLGELPHLKSLWLENVGVEYVVEEDEVGRRKPVEIQFLALEQLFLFDLPNLKGITKEQESKAIFPNLKQLRVERCSSFLLQPLSSLRKLEDLECSNSTLALFSDLDNLSTLRVMVEENTNCFQIEMVAKLSNLRLLKIKDAKSISATGEGLQALEKLERLGIHNCETMTCIPQGMLRHLTALHSLYILSCPEFVDLPKEINNLHNLELIRLYNLPKMACLPQALQNLSSLRRLILTRLPQLDSLPHWLQQLHTLNIVDCPKIVSLPVLSNLRELSVSECPELERRCKRGSGEEWHKVAHIPRLRFTC